MKKKLKGTKGITLIALVLTIIVLLILAGVTIATLTGDNGILSQAQNAKDITELSEEKEKIQLEVMASYETDGILSIEKLKSNIENYLKEATHDGVNSFPLTVTYVATGHAYRVENDGTISKKVWLNLSDSEISLQIIDDYKEEKEITAELIGINGTISWEPISSDVIDIVLSDDRKSATIRAKAAGEETITVACGNESKNCHITVTSVTSITNISVSPTTKTIREGEYFEIEATVNEDATEEIQWSVNENNSSKVSLSAETGKKITVTGLEEGENIEIIATGENKNKTAKCTLTINPPLGYFKQNGTKAYYYASADATEGTEITTANLGKYLGLKVNYTPKTKFSDIATSSTYRLFFIDIDGKYGDGNGTIYLKADYENNKTIYMYELENKSGATGENVMSQFNPEWSKRFPSGNETNAQRIKLMLDKGLWKGYTDTGNLSTSVIAKYAVGGPSLEMWIDSYNNFLNYNKPDNGSYKQFVCKIPYSGNTRSRLSSRKFRPNNNL